MSEINDIKELSNGTFLISLKLIRKYQREEPSIIDKYKDGTYHKGYFCGGSNIDIEVITCKDSFVIPSKIQSYVLHWCHTYILHPAMERTEEIISQNL